MTKPTIQRTTPTGTVLSLVGSNPPKPPSGRPCVSLCRPGGREALGRLAEAADGAWVEVEVDGMLFDLRAVR